MVIWLSVLAFLMPKGVYDRSVRELGQLDTAKRLAVLEISREQLFERIADLERRLQEANLQYFASGYVPPKI